MTLVFGAVVRPDLRRAGIWITRTVSYDTGIRRPKTSGVLAPENTLIRFSPTETTLPRKALPICVRSSQVQERLIITDTQLSSPELAEMSKVIFFSSNKTSMLTLSYNRSKCLKSTIVAEPTIFLLPISRFLPCVACWSRSLSKTVMEDVQAQDCFMALCQTRTSFRRQHSGQKWM